MSSVAATYAEAAMRRRSVLRLLVLAVAVTLGAAACSVGVGTPPEDYVAPDEQGGGNGDGGGAATDVDLLVDGPEVALADLADAVGTERVKALQLAIYSDSVYLEAQDPDDPSRVVVYNWNVGEGVTDGGELPVEDADDAGRVTLRENQVVEPEIIVNKHPTDIGGLARLEPGHDRLEGADVRGPGRPIARRPARDLPADIAVPATQVGQAGHRDVDIVQLDEGLHRAPAQPLDVAAGQAQLRGDVGAQDRPDDPLHDVEGRPEDVLVPAQCHHRRDRREDRGERHLQVVLADHVVRTLGLGAHRRPPEDDVAVGIPQQVGEIGDPAGELPNLRYAVQPPRVRRCAAEPGGDPLDVEGVLGADRSRPGHRARARARARRRAHAGPAPR